MGSTQSVPEEPTASEILDTTLAKSTYPPHPSRSNLNPATAARSAISYFLPISTPDLQHSHLSPTLDDIRTISDLLSTKLPPELAVRVLNEAKYWAGCRTLIQKDLTVVAGTPTPRGPPSGWRSDQERDVGELKDGRDGEVWYLVSEPVGCDESHTAGAAGGPRDARSLPGWRGSAPEKEISSEKAGVLVEDEDPDTAEKDEQRDGARCWLRGMIIETLSKDQGWSSAVTANPKLYGTYEHSYSWFELSLLRDGKEVEGTRRSFQNNIHAGQYFKAHRHVFGPDDELVRQARNGDRVIIWVRAQYPGWRNLVREAAITLYTAPFPPEA